MVSKISSNSEILKCRAEGVKVIGKPVNSHALELNTTKPRDKRSEIRPKFQWGNCKCITHLPTPLGNWHYAWAT